VTTIAVPARLPHEPEPLVQESAGAVLTDVRAAATAVSDVATRRRCSSAVPHDLDSANARLR